MVIGDWTDTNYEERVDDLEYRIKKIQELISNKIADIDFLVLMFRLDNKDLCDQHDVICFFEQLARDLQEMYRANTI